MAEQAHYDQYREPIAVLDASGAPALKPAKPGKAGGQTGPSERGGGGSKTAIEGGPPPAAQGSDQRRRDAIADAARTLDDLSPQGVREFVTRRWRGARALADGDVEQFSKDAIAQRAHDLVDALDNRLHRTNSGKSSASRVVRITPPRAWLKRTVSSLPEDELAQVLLRLRSRGWTEQQIKRDVLKPYLGDRQVEVPQLALGDEGFSVGSSRDG